MKHERDFKKVQIEQNPPTFFDQFIRFSYLEMDKCMSALGTLVLYLQVLAISYVRYENLTIDLQSVPTHLANPPRHQ